MWRQRGKELGDFVQRQIDVIYDADALFHRFDELRRYQMFVRGCLGFSVRFRIDGLQESQVQTVDVRCVRTVLEFGGTVRVDQHGSSTLDVHLPLSETEEPHVTDAFDVNCTGTREKKRIKRKEIAECSKVSVE